MNILKAYRKTTRYAWPDADRKSRYYLTRKAKAMIKADTKKAINY